MSGLLGEKKISCDSPIRETINVVYYISVFTMGDNYILLEIQYVFTADNRVTFQPKEESPFAIYCAIY